MPYSFGDEQNVKTMVYIQNFLYIYITLNKLWETMTEHAPPVPITTSSPFGSPRRRPTTKFFLHFEHGHREWPQEPGIPGGDPRSIAQAPQFKCGWGAGWTRQTPGIPNISPSHSGFMSQRLSLEVNTTRLNAILLTVRVIDFPWAIWRD